MKSLHIYSCLEVTQDGDEYLNYEFIMACSLRDAWFIAGRFYAHDIDEHDIEGGYSTIMNSTLTVNIFDMNSEEFWDVFDSYSNLWRDGLLAWAVENREDVDDLLQRAKENNCQALLNISELRSIAEQYALETAIKNRRSTASASKRHAL